MKPLVIDWTKVEAKMLRIVRDSQCLLLIILFLSQLYNNFSARSIALKECYLMMNFKKNSFSPCIMCVQYRGGCSVPWGVFSTVGDIMSTVGGIS